MTLEEMWEHFRLDGEAVYRRSNGNDVSASKQRGYIHVSVRVPGGKALQDCVHRIKFGLATGWLPPRVDHRNRDIGDNRLANLRAATPSQNGANRSSSKGYYVNKDGRYQAYMKRAGKPTYLGTFSTATEAEECSRNAKKEYYGEFYSG